MKIELMLYKILVAAESTMIFMNKLRGKIKIQSLLSSAHSCQKDENDRSLLIFLSKRYLTEQCFSAVRPLLSCLLEEATVIYEHVKEMHTNAGEEEKKQHAP